VAKGKNQSRKHEARILGQDQRDGVGKQSEVMEAQQARKAG